MTFQPIVDVRPVAIDAGHGPYGWLTPAIAAIAAHDQNFASRTLFLERSELHFIALCVALMGDKARDVDHLASFARNYGVMERKTLFAAFDETGVDGSIVKLVPKLAGRLWRAPSYRRLAQLFMQPCGRKVLRHLPFITRRQLLTLGRLPDAFRTHGVLKKLRKQNRLGEFLFAIEMVRQFRTDLDERQLVASFEKGASSYCRGWVTRHMEKAPFPEAPVPALMRAGVEALRPLSCYDDLARGAQEFDNCIRSYLWSVLRGDSYFYRYAPDAGGKGVAIVELRRAPIIGWVVHEALGPSNDPISGADRAAIVALFRNAGVPAAPQAVNPKGSWFELGGGYD